MGSKSGMHVQGAMTCLFWKFPFLSWTLVDYFLPESGIPRKSLRVLKYCKQSFNVGDNQASSVNSE
jgi:hypothetical protein